MAVTMASSQRCCRSLNITHTHTHTHTHTRIRAGNLYDQPVTEVLTNDAEIVACFRGVGWDASRRDGKGEWTACPPDWHAAARNLLQVRAAIAPKEPLL